MATLLRTSLTDHSPLDDTGDDINGAEVDVNSYTLADVLDGTTQTDLASADRIDILSTSTHGISREAVRLINLDAGAGSVQDVLRLEWDPASGGANASQGIGIVWYLSDSVNNQDEWAYMDVAASTVTSTAEDVQIRWGGFIAGASKELIEIGSAGFIFNEDGTDLDYRFESDTNASAFTLDAGLFSGVGAIGLGAAATNVGAVLIDPPAFTAAANTNIARLNIENTAAITVPAGTTAVAASLFLGEPNLTATGTITSAVTLYIEAAPTEGGTNNYALWVDSGVSAFGGNLVPDANDGAQLGISGTAFSDLFLASGGVINFAAGDVLATHSSNLLAFSGASSGYTYDAALLPSANDAAALGASGTAWADLFLASGAVINFLAGDVTITHSANTLAIAGASTGYSWDTGYMAFGAALGSTYPFYFANTKTDNFIMRIDNTVGAGSKGHGMQINFTASAPDDNTYKFFQGADNVTDRIYIWSDGDLQNHDNSYGAISDIALKQDIVDARDYWEDWKQIKFRKYRFKSDVETDENAAAQIGVIAQEIEQVFPGLVQVNGDSGLKGVKYSVMDVIAGRVLQECIARIETLEAN